MVTNRRSLLVKQGYNAAALQSHSKITVPLAIAPEPHSPDLLHETSKSCFSPTAPKSVLLQEGSWQSFALPAVEPIIPTAAQENLPPGPAFIPWDPPAILKSSHHCYTSQASLSVSPNPAPQDLPPESAFDSGPILH